MLFNPAQLSFLGRKTDEYFQRADIKNITLIIIIPLIQSVFVLLISKFFENRFRNFSNFDFPEELITGGNDIKCLDFYYFARS